MTTLSRRQFLASAAAAPLALHPCFSRAAGRVITLIVPYPPGGSLDAMARVVAQGLGDLRGQSVVVENKPGFSGNIGAQYVVKGPADGSMLLMTALTTYAINASLMTKTMGYDLMKDLKHVAIVGDLPNVLIAPSSLPVQNLTEFVQYAKTKPGQLSYATTGVGSLEHIAGEMLCRAAGIEMLAVPYKGSTPGVQDLFGGLIQAMFVNTSTAINNLKTGRIRVLGIAGPATVAALPGVQTFSAQGVRMMNDVVSIFGIAAPAGTPQPVVDALNQDINKVLAAPEVHNRFSSLGVDVVTQPSEFAQDRVRREIAIWDKVIKTTGITLD
ncbi:hypothetical protein CAL29_16815 [Bordetella genomosp. 10]|uniref:MFS transporter n=1 Tax=Bordetella genomosp. 10 TaxID=1416804 RepID=A0A261RXG3_9BORD|nr:tripartite tricarboxylate transporter substrate-binding protein [Bordetella genomosp. 10]OZI29789.1 hypothetical protein CAL29_16815 [Bordetella genomosp. 10]